METSFNKDSVSGQKRYANVSRPEKVPGRLRRKVNSQRPRSLHGIDPLIQATYLDNISIDPVEPKARHLYRLIKRLIDILVSLTVLVFALPVFLCIVIYIRKRSSGPVIFKQHRIAKNRRNHNGLTFRYYRCPESGEMLNDRRSHKDVFRQLSDERRKSNPGRLYYLCPKDRTIKADRRKANLLGRPFTFYKFRTMYSDAKKRFPELYAYRYTIEEIQHMRFKKDIDPRVPKWAVWLRQTSLDELPNFINVLRGDMSLVGPRPDIPELIKYYTNDQRIKLNVKPGITGLAQIEGRGHLGFQDTLKYDMEYVMNRSLLLDLKILVRTIVSIVRQSGAF